MTSSNPAIAPASAVRIKLEPLISRVSRAAGSTLRRAVWRGARAAPALVLAFGIAAPGARAAEKPLDKVTLALHWLAQCQFAGYFVALEKGYYRQQGIEMTIRTGAADTNNIQQVTAGAADFGTRRLADVIGVVDKGAPVISVAQILRSSGMVLVVRADSGINHPRDFANKRISIWLSGKEIQFYALMNQVGVDISKLKVSPMQYSVKPFLDGQYDVINAMTFNELPTLLKSVRRDQIRVFDFVDYGLNFPGDVLFTRRAMVKDHRDLARRMVRATLQGWRDALNDPEEATRIVLKLDRTRKLDPDHQLAQMKDVSRLIRLGDHALGTHVKEDVERVVGLLAKNKMISRRLTDNEIYTNELLP